MNQDRIFAFLGLAPEIADYQFRRDLDASVAEVYLEFASMMIGKSQSLDVLNFKRE